MPDPLVTTADGRFQRGITHKLRGFLGNTFAHGASLKAVHPGSAFERSHSGKPEASFGFDQPRRYGAEDFDEFCALLTKMLGPDGKVDVERMLQSAPGERPRCVL